MPLQPGTVLGPYQVTAKIGEGGMGEVYRARDTKLDRDVALKVLPEAFTADSDRLARFEREAKVLASLNHPNIGSIYGLEEADGGKFRALVLELIEGPTLADRIAQGPIPIDEAILIAKQIAEALEAAHEQGVIHRDLKPANVKVKADGTVKVLDFGLAKALDTTPQGDPSLSPTLTAAATQMGVIMGTAAYMSPEQARGQTVDKRIDIWAFGAVLFEMVTGRRAFDGRDVSETMGGVLRLEPEWDALGPSIPRGMTSLIRRCLQKEPRLRVRDIGDARLALAEASEPIRGDDHAEVSQEQRGRWRTLPWVAALLATGAVSGFAGFLVRSQASPPVPTQRLSIDLSMSAPIFVPRNARSVQDDSALAISPDGTQLVYVGMVDGIRLLHVRSLDSLTAKPLTGTEGAAHPFLSPNGEWVGYFAQSPSGPDDELRRVPVGGGPSIPLCDTRLGIGGVWGADGRIVFSAGDPAELHEVSQSGGPCERLTMPGTATAESYMWPDLLPDGATLIVSAASTTGVGALGRVGAMSRQGGEYRDLIDEGHRARYLPTGHLVYYLNGDLMAVSFDADCVAVTGSPVPVVEGVAGINFAISDTGALVYLSDRGTSRRDSLVWVDREGRSSPAFGEPGNYDDPSLSPDGRSLAVGIDNDIWIIDLERASPTRLTFGDRGPGTAPITAWSPTGQRVTFNRQSPAGEYTLETVDADGSGEAVRMWSSPDFVTPGSWSPDGSVLAVYQMRRGNNDRDLAILRPGENPQLADFLATSFNERGPAFSPSGRWIAYSSNLSGRDQVYVRPYPATGGGQITISTDGGNEPVWSSDGRELFYRNGPSMMVVKVSSGTDLAPEAPSRLFEGEYRSGSARVRGYDVTPDGERFIMIAEERQAPQSLDVVLGWFTQLEERVPLP